MTYDDSARLTPRATTPQDEVLATEIGMNRLLADIFDVDPELSLVENYFAQTGETELNVTLRSEHPELD